MPPVDTIYALSTPPGRGGISIVRVSGPRAAEGALALTGHGSLEPNRLTICNIIHPVTRSMIDQALVVFFRSPASYTGEDTVEYHMHGSKAVVSVIYAALAHLPGYRLAEPGEFTRRAFENGKIDLTEAEAIDDLIDAETEAQRAQAIRQLSGALSDLYEDWSDRLKHALAHMEADIDFPDEDLPDGVGGKVKPELGKILDEIREHLNDNRRGERLRDGIHIAVIGAPNAGKSTLVNALARREVSIVSPQPGTTRDIVETHLDMGGYPVIVSDTAGLRPEQVGETGHDAIESEGIRRALKRARDADIRLLVFDASMPEADRHTLALAGENSIAVINKSDILAGSAKELSGLEKTDIARISAKTGAGMKELSAMITGKIKEIIGGRQGPAPTRARHRSALEECAESLSRALAAGQTELAAEDVRLSLRALGRITGRVDVEDLLDVIFRDFCIGK
ncbi:MAG: tRNA uridine-5-carboxymethylaminomethyl(34) synthesis GTPase MnmE [Proteobacteria bacterium]|nr:tRNA uridine-5-carboxymethylaminomethyl(34) synthesis GTPase MnmE [Pseudomonadota bacterium]